MPDMAYILLLYYGLINLLLFCMMGYDKSRAKRNKWRVPEATLFTVSLLGGGIGGFVGMFQFHHKNRKPYFYLIYTISILLHAGIVFLLYYTFYS